MPLDDARAQDLVERAAAALERLGVAAPAAFFLEWNRPLAFLGSQALLFAGPFLSPFVAPQTTNDYAALLEDHGGLERLIERLTAGPPGERA
ncbi:MAG: hypothetical protein GX605_02725 [Chloroflexi bacterium]|nr:hypothetical protein [Chloroflexota bacterium]